MNKVITINKKIREFDITFGSGNSIQDFPNELISSGSYCKIALMKKYCYFISRVLPSDPFADINSHMMAEVLFNNYSFRRK
jgi:hypothetical protein